MAINDNILDLSVVLKQRRAKAARSAYQSKAYVCLDVVTHDTWQHRWRWVEVVRKAADGSVALWQFHFDQNNLEFRHYHRAVPATADTVPTECWKGMRVVEHFPPGFESTRRLDVPRIEVPEDVLVEAMKNYLLQMEGTITASGPAFSESCRR